jgi:hypothetical protein
VWIVKKFGRTFHIAMFGCFLILSCASSIAAQDIHFNYLPGTDFSRYRTYKWVQIPGAQYPNQILDNQIKQSIDTQLSTKGLTKTESDSPDLFIVYQFAVDKQQQWNSYSSGGDMWGWGGWGGWGGMSTTTTTSSTINIGNLDLDVYDFASKKQIWRGEATKTIKKQKDPAKLQKNLDKAMAKLLSKYPPPAKKS